MLQSSSAGLESELNTEKRRHSEAREEISKLIGQLTEANSKVEKLEERKLDFQLKVVKFAFLKLLYFTSFCRRIDSLALFNLCFNFVSSKTVVLGLQKVFKRCVRNDKLSSAFVMNYNCHLERPFFRE